MDTSGMQSRCQNCKRIVPFEDTEVFTWANGHQGEYCTDCIRILQQFARACDSGESHYKVVYQDFRAYVNEILCPRCAEKDTCGKDIYARPKCEKVLELLPI